MKAFLRRLFRSIAIFAAAGLAGPLLRYVTWPPFDPEDFGNPFDTFLYHLVLLIWPAQPLAVYEATLGTFVAGLYAVGANILLFAVLGALASPFARRCAWMLLSYTGVCGLVTWYGLLWSGFSVEFLHLPALAVALVFYSLPFWLLRRASIAPQAGEETPSWRSRTGAARADRGPQPGSDL